MEEDRFISSRENPRNLGFLHERGGVSSNNKSIQSEIIQKAPQILDQFRALVKEREEELRVSDEDDDDVPELSAEEIVRCYEAVLSELTFNSKPIITELTIIAGEQREYAEGIADAICARIIEVPVEQKLPSLYLLDSIVKNIGGEYVRCFASRLPEVFCVAYRQVHPNLHPSMRHLFGTWSAVFPSSILRKIGVELQFSPHVNHQSLGSTALRSSESPSPRPPHGIHVNPKYLEARRQFEHATVVNDVQDSKGISSNLQIYGQKPAFGYGEYDIDQADVIPPRVGIRRLDSPGIATHTSLGGAERLLPSLETRFLRSSSPSRVGLADSLSPSTDGFTTENSPGRVVERTSPSHCGFEYGPGRINKGDGERNDWWMKHRPDVNPRQLETSGAYNLSNGHDQQRPRALIDAYGNYRGKSTLNEKPLKVERLDVNGINDEVATRRWQNTEEEEYVWEEMSPTLADRSRSNDLMPSNPPLGNISVRTSLGRPAAVMEPDFRRGNWPRHGQLPVVDDSAFIAEDGISILGPGHGSMNRKYVGGTGTRSETAQIQGSQEPWNLPHHVPHSSQQFNNPKASGKAVQMSSPATRTSPSAGQRIPSLLDNSPDAEAQFQRLSSVVSRYGSSSSDSSIREVQMPHSTPVTPLIWPPVNVHKPHQPLWLPPITSQQKQIKGQLDLFDANTSVINQGPNKSLILPQQQLDAVVERKALSSHELLQFPNQQSRLISSNNQNQGQGGPLQTQQLKYQETSYIPPMPIQLSSHSTSQPLNHGHNLQGRGAIMGAPLMSQIPSIARTSFQLPPLPPGPPPVSSQMGSTSQNMGPVASLPPVSNAFSGLISSLMAQGLITMTTPVSVQDSVGVEFDPDVLKLRHESAINSLYFDLPRQCKTCGLRFKCQEEHSSHMDWHVTKNRISKNRKQKPSRKWFVSTSMWLSGAEALGTDAAPGFLPTEAIVEKKDDEEMSVPADENQNACALCGEPFDDFYSDETEEWMYKGAVYLNAPDGLTETMDRSQLGPIVHAKCRSESTAISPEDFGLDEEGKADEGNQSKRMRI